MKDQLRISNDELEAARRKVEELGRRPTQEELDIVKERHQQIGMLRAIGFKRKMILRSFVIETSFVALLGIALGALLGVILGVRIWLDGGFEDLDFIVPWSTLAWVSTVAFDFTLICTISPARGAARIPPAEALRYTG